MGIRNLRPMTNGQRNMSYCDNAQVTHGKPQVKSLLKRGKKISGRNNGKISIRHRGGGTRPQYRMVDFNGTDKLGIPAKIVSIEYDPNRTAFIQQITYKDGEKRYQLAHKKARVDDIVLTDAKTELIDGNRCQVQNIPVGFAVYNIEITPGKGGQVARTAGNEAKIVSLEGEKVQIQFASGEIRLVERTNYATIGKLSNEERALMKVGKAGRKRHMGRRPQVRGKVMNPNDHPHGGGEAGTSIGMKYPKTPWGAHALGVKTRKNRKSDKLIVLSRHRAKKR